MKDLEALNFILGMQIITNHQNQRLWLKVKEVHWRGVEEIQHG